MSYRRVRKESDELSYTIWSLVMVPNRLPTQVVKDGLMTIANVINMRSRSTKLLTGREEDSQLLSFLRFIYSTPVLIPRLAFELIRRERKEGSLGGSLRSRTVHYGDQLHLNQRAFHPGRCRDLAGQIRFNLFALSTPPTCSTV